MKHTQADLDKEFEQIEAMGSDNQKQAVADTQKIMQDEQQKVAEHSANEIELLTKKKKFTKKEYTNTLAMLLYSKCYEDELPAGWEQQIKPDEIGVRMELLAPNGRLFAQAFKVSGDPFYDLAAVELFVIRMENTVERYYGRGEKKATAD